MALAPPGSGITLTEVISTRFLTLFFISLALCKCKPDGRYECLVEYLIDERWRDKPQNLQLKIAYEKEIIMSETSSVDQLTKKDKERMEFMLVMVYISQLPFA